MAMVYQNTLQFVKVLRITDYRILCRLLKNYVFVWYSRWLLEKNTKKSTATLGDQTATLGNQTATLGDRCFYVIFQTYRNGQSVISDAFLSAIRIARSWKA